MADVLHFSTLADVQMLPPCVPYSDAQDQHFFGKVNAQNICLS